MPADRRLLALIIRAVRIVRLMIGALLLVSACTNSSAPPSFALVSARTDPAYWCPGNANNAPYDVHATVDAHNGTASPVTIESATASMTLQDVSSTWLEKAGEVYDAGAATFTPATIAPRSSAKLSVTIHSACTSPAYGSSNSSYGDYRVTMRFTTSAGAYSISAANLHRILAA